MLHAVFQNIRAFLISAFVGGFSSAHSSPSESSTFIVWSCSQTAWKISKSVNAAATGMPSKWTSTLPIVPLHTFRKFNDSHRRSRPHPLNGRPSREVMKNKLRNSGDVWGKCPPHVSLQVEREIPRTSIVNAG
ncbi:hypothetical protein AVEN_126640-1 [Araneus ventricosus]|uniref:Secreted protein n=1 Tax=Araneus ventricosus TaxID=182803 RepID=A0A4Y2R9B1_ARAVE|nr:hypothetical protein AVEN_126640-1 [Araneus ventricosus]